MVAKVRLFLPIFIGLSILFVLSHKIDIHSLIDEFGKRSALSFFSASFLMGLNCFLASGRFLLLLRAFGLNAEAKPLFLANVNGLFYSQFSPTIFGNIVGREAYLRKVGVGSVSVVFVSIVEKLLVLFVLSVLTLLSAHFILEEFLPKEFLPIEYLAKSGLLQMCLVLLLSASFALKVSKIKFLKITMLRTEKLFCLFSSIFLTVSVLGVTVLAIVVLTAPDFETFKLQKIIPICLMIILISSLPISFNGWGVREGAFVVLFGYFGFSLEASLSISIMFGFATIFGVTTVYVFGIFTRKFFQGSRKIELIKENLNVQPYETLIAYIIGFLACVCVFFQLEMQFLYGRMSVNLADVWALASSLIFFFVILRKKFAPEWKVKFFNFFLISFSILLIFAFIIGVINHGVTGWAVSNRLFGWIIIIGYLLIGQVATNFASPETTSKLVVSFIITSIVIVIFEVIFRKLQLYAGISFFQFSYDFMGYSANRNTFCFQLLLSLCLLLALNEKDNWPFLSKQVFGFSLNTISVAILLFGIWLTGSKSGLITLPVLILCYLFVKPSGLRTIFSGFALASLIVLITSLGEVFFELGNLSNLPTGASTANVYDKRGTFGANSLIPKYSVPESNQIRFETWRVAIGLMQQNIFLGSGLGSIYEKTREIFGYPEVVHNTQLWLLAEFGVLSSFAIAIILFIMMKNLFVEGKGQTYFLPSLLILSCFGMFSIFHDIFYQRAFWLVLGLVISSKSQRLV